MLSLYLHFPFCKRKCSYCDFCSAVAGEGEIAAYCAALETEIGLYAEKYSRSSVDTVFLGGGTPSVVPAPLMRRVLQTLRERFVILPDAEFTSEANPGTVTAAWLDAIREAGANRLSLGVQAIQGRLLNTLGRIHTYEQALDAIALARKHGFANLNADAMFGLPSQTAEEYLDTLTALAQTGVTHISAYSLILEEGTPLHAAVTRGDYTLPDEDETADMMEQGIDRLEALGYRRYEISNFAKPGYECRHNLGYWRQKRYLGLGLAAASLLPTEPLDGDAAYVRHTNTDDLKTYLSCVSQGRLPTAERTPIPPAEARFETLMLGLRTTDGVSYADFERMHGMPLRQAYGTAIDKLAAIGLLMPETKAEPRLALNRRGLALQNTALMTLMEDR